MTRLASVACGGLVVLALAGCRCAPDNLGVTRELKGLKVSIQRANRSASTVDLFVALERSASSTWRLRAIESVQPSFWDDAGKPIGGAQGPIPLPLDPAFIDLRTDRTTATVQVRPPPDACTVSLALGVSGLETPRIRIP